MKKAFTMIELVFVIVILGILASVSLPRLAATRSDAEISSMLANLKTFLNDASAYYAANGSFIDNDEGAKYVLFTNVPLYYAQTGHRIDDNANTKDTMISLGVAGKPCIDLAIQDIKERTKEQLNYPTFVFFRVHTSNNNSLCKAVRNSKVIQDFTHGVVMGIDGKALSLNPLTTGGIAISPSAKIY